MRSHSSPYDTCTHACMHAGALRALNMHAHKPCMRHAYAYTHTHTGASRVLCRHQAAHLTPRAREALPHPDGHVRPRPRPHACGLHGRPRRFRHPHHRAWHVGRHPHRPRRWSRSLPVRVHVYKQACMCACRRACMLHACTCMASSSPLVHPTRPFACLGPNPRLWLSSPLVHPTLLFTRSHSPSLAFAPWLEGRSSFGSSLKSSMNTLSCKELPPSLHIRPRAHCSARSGQARSGQVRLGLVRSGHVGSGRFSSGHVRLGHVRPGQVRSGQVGSGQVKPPPPPQPLISPWQSPRTGSVMSNVRSGQVKWAHLSLAISSQSPPTGIAPGRLLQHASPSVRLAHGHVDR